MEYDRMIGWNRNLDDNYGYEINNNMNMKELSMKTGIKKWDGWKLS